MIRAIAFDADDTLWHTESMFQETQARLSEILEHYAAHDEVQARLHDTEVRNVRLFGYGIKGFTLSMVEAAIELSKGRISGHDIHEIVMMGRSMLEAPMELLDGVPQILEQLAGTYPLYLITKGDLLDQRNKIEKSGLAAWFSAVEIVTEKNAATYHEIFSRHGLDPAVSMMVGNSVPSDIVPVLEIGGWAVHIPYVVTASIERHDQDPTSGRFSRLSGIGELPGLLGRLDT